MGPIKSTSAFHLYLHIVRWLRSYLHSQISGGIVSLLSGTIGSIFMSAGWYRFAQACFALSTLTGALWALSWNTRIVSRLIGIFVVFGLGFLLCGAVESKISADAIHNFHDQLTADPAGLMPDNKPSPPNICQGKNEANILLGDNVIGSSKLHYVAIQIRGEDALVFDRDKSGTLYVTFNDYDSSGHIIAIVNRNKVVPFQHFANLIPRHDLHSLSMVDDYNNIIFSIEYINPNTIRFIGEINRLGVNLTIYENAMLHNGSSWSDGSTCDAEGPGFAFF